MDKHIKVTDDLVTRIDVAMNAAATPPEPGVTPAQQRAKIIRAGLSVITPADIVEAETIPMADFLSNPGETTAAALRSE